MKTSILLSFSTAYNGLAQRIAQDLRAASVAVVYDQWDGGGGVPATQSVPTAPGDVNFVLPIVTPSDAAESWLGPEWKRAIYDKARARNIEVLPILGHGDLSAIPEFLRNRSHAVLIEPNYAIEIERLIGTIRRRSGDESIQLPVAAQNTSAMSPAEPVVLEVSDELMPLFENDFQGSNPFIDEMVPMLRDGLFYELGVAFPEMQLRAGTDIPASSARLLINGVPEAEVEVRMGSVMVNETVDAMAERGFVASPGINLALNAASAWIAADRAAEARELDLTTWTEHQFLNLSLSAVLRRKAAAFIGINDAQAMLDQIKPVFPKLVAETVPGTVPLFTLTDVLRRLVTEEVSIRNLRWILMALADWGRVEQDPLFLTEYVRAALQRQITYQLSRGSGDLIVFLLDPDLEKEIADAMQRTTTASYVALEPNRVRQILEAIQRPFRAFPDGIQMPQILTILEIRSFIRRLVAGSMPRLHVLSYQELMPEAKIQPIGRISIEGFTV